MRLFNQKLKLTLFVFSILLVGTAAIAINNYPTEAKIIKEDCIHCGECVSAASNLFKLEDDGATFTDKAPDGFIYAEYYDEFLDAYAACPTYAIKFKWEQ